MEPTLDPILRPKHPNRSQDDTNTPIRCIKKPKAAMIKNLKKLMFFFKFLATHTSQKKLKRHKKAPKKHPKNTKIPKERIQP